MGEPQTEAGRALLGEAHDASWDAPGPWWHMSANRMGSIIAAIEQQAAANERARLAARVEWIRPSHSHPVGPDRLCVAAFCPAGMQDAVLRLLREGAAG